MCGRMTSTRERIAGARLLPLSRLDRFAVPHEPGKALLLQCNSGNRSAKAPAGIALPEGVRLYHLVGGIQAWKRGAAGGERRAGDTGGGRVSGLGSW
jgi:rhodanese-related sulfurtransferase